MLLHKSSGWMVLGRLSSKSVRLLGSGEGVGLAWKTFERKV